MKIFLSYARTNKEYMQGIEKALSTQIREKKITLWIDKNKLYPTEKFDTTITKQIEDADMVLLLLSIDFWSSEYIQTKEFPLIMEEHRNRGLLIFPIILEDISDFTRHKKLEGIFAYPFDDEGNFVSIEDFSIKARAYNKIAIKIVEIVQGVFKNPFKHLSYFDEEDSHNFYGRKSIAKELANATLTLKAGLLFGESGVGKTSLILAGVMNELNKNDNFQALYIRCMKNVVNKLRIILCNALGVDGSTEGEILEQYIGKSNKKILLIFDQFEEMFITVSENEKSIFFEKILVEISSIKGVHILFSLRADYLWKLNPYRDKFDGLWNRAVGLERLNKEESLKAITLPLQNNSIEKNLAEKIYTDLCSEETQTVQVHTPFLQLVMFELYIKAIGKNSLKITQKLYDELGGVHGIVTGYFDGLLIKFNAEEHKSLEKLFFYLVTDSSTRDSLSKEYLETIFSTKTDQVKIYRLIDTLIKERVVRHVTDIDEYYELVHDILALHISKRFNLRQNIKHLSNRLAYLEVEKSSHHYLSEKELYEVLIYQELFDFQEKHHVQIVRNIIKHQLKAKTFIVKHQKLFRMVLIELLQSKDDTEFTLALQSIDMYKELIDDVLKKRISTKISERFEILNNNNTQTYWILTLLIELKLEPNENELSMIYTLTSDLNSNWDIFQQAILLMLKYDFGNQKFIEKWEAETIFDFIDVGKRDGFIKEVIFNYIDHMEIDGYLEYLLEKLDIYASDMFDDEDDDIVIYKYALLMVNSFCDYVEDDVFIVKSANVTEKIENKLTGLYLILASKISEDRVYEKLFEQLEKILLGGVFEFNGTLLIEGFVTQSNPPYRFNKKVAFDLASSIPTESLDIIIERLNEDNEIIRQNAYALLIYRFDDIMAMDLGSYKHIDYDEINTFVNFNTKKRLFEDLSLSTKDIQIKRLELYFDASLGYEQLILWENNIEKRLQRLNQTVSESVKNIMTGSFTLKDREFFALKDSLRNFLGFLNLDLMFEKLLNNFEKLNISAPNGYIARIREEVDDYGIAKVENRKQDMDTLLKEIIVSYKGLEIEFKKLEKIDFLSNVIADIKLMEAYIEAENLNILFDYWLDYLSDMVYLSTQQSDKASFELKQKLLDKSIILHSYDTIKMLFKDVVSKTNDLQIKYLESTQDWHIIDTLLECYYDLKVDIPLHTINLLLENPQVRIRQFSFRLLMLHSQIDNSIKREKAFKYLDNTSLRFFALELLEEVGVKEDILKLMEYRSIQDINFQEKLSESVERIFSR